MNREGAKPDPWPGITACLRARFWLSLFPIKTAHLIPNPPRWPVAGPALLLVWLAWLGPLPAQESNPGAAEPLETEQAETPQLPADDTPDPNRWIVASLNVAAVICFVSWWRWMGRRGNPGTARPGGLALARSDVAADDEWKIRALVAEARAEKATALLRAKLLPQLARWMMGEMVQRLLTHRSELVTSQQQAEQEVAELETRLEKIHAPLAERLQAYERRIAELERELAAKGEENRELIKARIASARKKLASERAKDSPTWN